MHYHLIGIAGTAMASLAGLLQAKGHEVTGSDEGVYPPMSDLLDDLGIDYADGYAPENLEPRPDVVVVGNAISRGNPELEAVLDARIPYASAAATLRRECLEGRHVLAVAGTHGKTTTTSLLAWLLECDGLEPSFLVGGVAENFGTSFRLTDGEHFVIEADEYDTAYFDKAPKMWHYRPWTAVLNNVEFDHADIYRDQEAYELAFRRFVNLVPGKGTLVVGWDTPAARRLSEGSFAPVHSVGIEGDEAGGDEERGPAPDPSTAPGTERGPVPVEDEVDASDDEVAAVIGSGAAGPGADAAHPRWRARDVRYGESGTSFELVHDGAVVGYFESALTGGFNLRNAVAAVAAARAVGASWQGIRHGLASFESVRRRMEVRGEVAGVTLVDDFAHHPTSVRGTIEAARQRFPGRRVVAVFEPRSYTAQRREFQEAYREALAGADRVVLAGLFRPERYDETTGMDPEELASELRADGVEATHVPEVDAIVARVVEETEEGDVVLIMSNGGFGGIHEKLLERLADEG